MQGVLKRSRSIIFSAILKHGLENFSLTILEYCLVEELLEREDYYITTFKPEYNILQKAPQIYSIYIWGVGGWGASSFFRV
jgi:group I intron endonuclease